ncbi:MAG: tRNA 2-selenouridine(34) synthase MnmH [Nanoarchaeota archaeon]|nr:tRNA 2-selenouridine(34) synthase MnmH [Nanoarchaeota archaeon]
MIPKISVEKAVHSNAIFIDTRTPKEFAEDHLPNAVNIPLFSNDERAIIGTLYKQVSQEKAIEKGVELFSQRLPDFMREIHKVKDKELIIYCWRGGMRSKAVVSLLAALGYNVQQLEGGHKQYRRYVREKLEQYTITPKLIILWGLTCSGKTALLSHFPNALNLEQLAQHRGSLYGGIGLSPNTQKRFESLLLQRLEQLQEEKYIVVEGESKRIGKVVMPAFLSAALKKGIHVFVKRSLEKRASLAMNEYFTTADDITKIKEITLNLKKVISTKDKNTVVQLLDRKKYQDAAKILLQQYYDPLYTHTLKNIHYQFELNNNDIETAAQELKSMF